MRLVLETRWQNVLPAFQVSDFFYFKYLFLRHAVQLCIPGGGVRAVIGWGRGKVLKYDWISLPTQRRQVTYIQLQFIAILSEIQERRKHLQDRKYILLKIKQE